MMRRLLGVLEGIVAAVLAAIAALVIYQVGGRYLLGNPPSWTEELARYLQVWLVLLAAPICLARGMHLSVDYLTPKLPAGPRRLVQRIVLVLIATFSLLLTFYGLRLLPVAALQTSPALGLSMVWPYLAVPVSGAAMSIVCVMLWIDARDGAEEERRVGNS
jgi:TRAP-type C4-dicarboxylate transport system permease small subunit